MLGLNLDQNDGDLSNLDRLSQARIESALARIAAWMHVPIPEDRALQHLESHRSI